MLQRSGLLAAGPARLKLESHLAPPLLDPCCVGGDLEGGGSSGGWLQGEGGGAAKGGEKGGLAAKKREK